MITNIVLIGMSKKRITCWRCHLNGKNILDKYGCCKRCGTNLKKYPTLESHQYPDLEEKHETETLGHRARFVITDSDGQGDW